MWKVYKCTERVQMDKVQMDRVYMDRVQMDRVHMYGKGTNGQYPHLPPFSFIGIYNALTVYCVAIDHQYTVHDGVTTDHTPVRCAAYRWDHRPQWYIVHRWDHRPLSWLVYGASFVHSDSRPFILLHNGGSSHHSNDRPHDYYKKSLELALI